MQTERGSEREAESERVAEGQRVSERERGREGPNKNIEKRSKLLNYSTYR